jgi:hypothetical protein
LTGDNDLLFGGTDIDNWQLDPFVTFLEPGFLQVLAPELTPGYLWWDFSEGWYLRGSEEFPGLFDASDFEGNLYLTIGGLNVEEDAEHLLIIDGKGDDSFAVGTYGWHFEKTIELSSGGHDTVYFADPSDDGFSGFSDPSNDELNDLNLITDFSTSGPSQDLILVDVYSFDLGNTFSINPGWISDDEIEADCKDNCNDIADGLQTVAVNQAFIEVGIDEYDFAAGQTYNLFKFEEAADSENWDHGDGNIDTMGEFWVAIFADGEIDVTDPYTMMLCAGYSVDEGAMILFIAQANSDGEFIQENYWSDNGGADDGGLGDNLQLNGIAKVEMTYEEYLDADLTQLLGFYDSDYRNECCSEDLLRVENT